MSSVLATNFHRNPLNLKNLNIFFKYVFLFKKQFDDKIFKTYRTRVYINNVDNDYDLFFYILVTLLGAFLKKLRVKNVKLITFFIL